MTSHPAVVDRSAATGLVRWMIRIAMLVFSYTIVIGILNGLDLVDFTRTQLLSHLHGGTLGWMTLSILAVTVWLFAVEGPPPSDLGRLRLLVIAACVAIPAYVITFATTTGALRPVAGTVTLLSLVGFAAWAFGRARQVDLDVPRLLVLLGLASSVIGGLFGVTNGLAIAFSWSWVPDTFFGAHAATMEVGFIIPAALGVAEWGLARQDAAGGSRPLTRSGRWQVGLMALAFTWVLVLILADLPEVGGLGILFAIIGVGIFYRRTAGLLRQAGLRRRGPTRHAVAGAAFIGITLVYIFVVIQLAGGDFEQVPRERMLSFIHLMAVGGTTNALLAFVTAITTPVRKPGVVDDLVFWGVNVGLVGFVIGLTLEIAALVALFVPLMGLGLLVAIVVYLPRLGADQMPAASS